ncbi:Pre-mRNA-splicing factor SLU7-A [Camellia lanceoleosa]|uniref:Pre-mRNA-splicing factor SLU7-A n=1 Tax=Camellia lanceoleosa TaxID=1840588 RepID=A0ACC0G9C7_9ERIC|nr:Pre-mRNA-splicing factor SLU7-A [Camellia lanceoleosa]
MSCSSSRSLRQSSNLITISAETPPKLGSNPSLRGKPKLAARFFSIPRPHVQAPQARALRSLRHDAFKVLDKDGSLAVVVSDLVHILTKIEWEKLDHFGFIHFVQYLGKISQDLFHDFGFIHFVQYLVLAYFPLIQSFMIHELNIRHICFADDLFVLCYPNGKESLLIPEQTQVMSSSIVNRCPHRSEIQSIALAETENPNYTKSWYDRGEKIYQAEKFRKGAYENIYTMGQNASISSAAPAGTSRTMPSASPIPSAGPPTQSAKEYDFSSLTQGFFSKS